MAFSTLLYGDYSNMETVSNTEVFELTSDIFKDILANHFNCPNTTGIRLQESKSHWSRRYVGEELMTTSITSVPIFSNFTLALYEATGWYPEINRALAEPLTWGRGTGCGFLEPDNCSFACLGKQRLECNWECQGMGECSNSLFQGDSQISACRGVVLSSQQPFLCRFNTSEAYKLGETRGSYSKCFQSDIREKGVISP